MIADLPYLLVPRFLCKYFLLFQQLWGVDVVSSNAVNWMECVAKGKQVTLKPISKENNELVSTVLLHLHDTKVES